MAATLIGKPFCIAGTATQSSTINDYSTVKMLEKVNEENIILTFQIRIAMSHNIFFVHGSYAFNVTIG